MPSYRRGRWIARQKRDGIEYCIGTFQTYDQAVQAQNRFNARWPRRLNKDTLVFRKELEQLINRNSRENGSNTPDFILAQYIEGCLKTFDETVKARDAWYSVNLEPGNAYFTTDRSTPTPDKEHHA